MSLQEVEATFVIIGGGIAGVSCLEGLVFLCPDENVILITSSPVVKIASNVIPLTKTLSYFDVEEKSTETLASQFPNLIIIRSTVTAIDPQNHTVTTENGKLVKFKKLCICSGGYPKLIAEGNPYVLGIRDTESVKDFEERIKDAERIIIIGNGGIATEVVHEVEGIEIIWVIKDKHISATFVDPGASEFFQSQLCKDGTKLERECTGIKRLVYTVSEEKTVNERGAALGPDWHHNINITRFRNEKSKVSVEYECEVKEILMKEDLRGRMHEFQNLEDKWPVYVCLTNGKIFGCNFLISATGVIPNTSAFVKNNSLQVADDGGLKVDWKMETSLPGIFAAGDVCSADWEKAFHWFQMRLWTQARQMGTYAAKCMVGSLRGEEIIQDFCFELFSHVTYFFGYKVILLGLFNGQKLDGEYEVLLRVTKGKEYIKLVMKDGKMQGAVLIGETDLEEMCENLILNQLDLSIYGEDLLNPNIDIEDYFD